MNANYDRSIIASVQKMTGTYNIDTVYLVTGNVLSVDEAAGTCSVEAISGNAATNIDGVEFQTVIADGVLIIPKIDSEVKVLFSKYTTPFIVQYSEVDKIYLGAELVQFNDGNLGGMVKVIDLTTKLNNLENKVNDILTAFNAHTHTSTAPSTPTTPPLAPIVGTLTPTQQTDIENTLIVQ
jgi:hypothetical protein